MMVSFHGGHTLWSISHHGCTFLYSIIYKCHWIMCESLHILSISWDIRFSVTDMQMADFWDVAPHSLCHIPEDSHLHFVIFLPLAWLLISSNEDAVLCQRWSYSQTDLVRFKHWNYLTSYFLWLKNWMGVLEF